MLKLFYYTILVNLNKYCQLVYYIVYIICYTYYLDNLWKKFKLMSKLYQENIYIVYILCFK